MSRENVEIVRDYYERLGSALDAYWRRSSGSIHDALGLERVRELVHEEVEWKPSFTSETVRGVEGGMRAIEDWLEACEDWRLSVEKLVDAGGDRVFGEVNVHMRGKGSGVAVDQRLFMVYGLRESRIALFEAHLDREEAMRAAGLRVGDVAGDCGGR